VRNQVTDFLYNICRVLSYFSKSHLQKLHFPVNFWKTDCWPISACQMK